MLQMKFFMRLHDSLVVSETLLDRNFLPCVVERVPTALCPFQGAGLDNPKAVEDDTPAPGAQVEAAIAKVKELESLIVLNKTEKVGQ